VRDEDVTSVGLLDEIEGKIELDALGDFFSASKNI
jgi:hypothetical protein